MKTTICEINGRIYNLKVVETEEEAQEGLSEYSELKEDEGMMFPFEEEDNVVFTMDEMTIPIDIIFVNEENQVIRVVHAKPGDRDIYQKAKTVLELHIDSDVEVGDTVFFDSTDDTNQMYILDEDGNIQMALEGGERIFSRKSTLQMIRLAKRAKKMKKNKVEYNKICVKLGKYIFKELDAQDNRNVETVNLPD